MKTIIAGSRTIKDFNEVFTAVLDAPWRITEVVSGGAQGVDQLGEDAAVALHVPMKRFTPDWNNYGKRAGFIRNVAMADYADALIAVWDGESKGTKHMIETALDKKLKVHVHIWRK